MATIIRNEPVAAQPMVRQPGRRYLRPDPPSEALSVGPARRVVRPGVVRQAESKACIRSMPGQTATMGRCIDSRITLYVGW